MAPPPPAVAVARGAQVAFQLCGGRWYQKRYGRRSDGAASGHRADIRAVVAPAHADLLGDFCNKIFLCKVERRYM